METFKAKINEVRDILRKDGVTGIDSITHCVAFYILRNLDVDLCEKLNIPVKFAFENFNKDDNGNVLDHAKLFEKFYLPSRPMDCFVGILANKFKFKAIKQFGIKTSRYLENIFNIFASFDPKALNCNYDIVGTIYEIHLATGTTGSGMRDLGQYFTHRKVIKYMIELCAPKVVNGRVETILDPSMGTGGFLTMATKYLNEHNQGIDWVKEQGNIIGFDISDSVQSLAYINLLLENGTIFENIVSHDTLHNDFIANNVHIDKVDNILANVPFGLKNIIHADCAKRIVDLKIRGTKAEPLFLQLIMLSLKENGRCAVIIPDGVLFNDAKLHTETRKYLIENMNVKKVVSLDDDAFFLNTGVKSSILYFVNNGTTQEVEFSKIKLSAGEIVEETIKKVKKNELVEKGYTLFINKYLDNQVIKLSGIEYKKLGNIVEFLPKSKRAAEFGKDEGNIPFYTSSNKLKFCNEADYKEESIIIGTGGNANIKYSNMFSCSADNFIIKSIQQQIMTKYLYYYLHSNLTILSSLFQGTTIKHLGKQSLIDIEIPIPPLELQQQLVDALDNIYSVIQKNKEQIAKYEAIKKAKITFATLNCSSKKLSALVSFKAGKYNSSDKKETGAYPFYTTEACSPVGFSDEYCFDYPNYLLLIKDGGSGAGKYGDQIGLGKVFNVSGKTATTSMVLALIPNTETNNQYVYYYMQTIKNKIMDLANYTTGLGHVRKSVIEDLNIPIPSPAIQTSIVQECEHIDGLIATLTKENERLEADNLIQTILATIGNTNEPPTSTSTEPDETQSQHNDEQIDTVKPVKKVIKKKTVSQKPVISANTETDNTEPIIIENNS